MKIGQISEVAFFTPKFGTLDPVTEVTSDNLISKSVPNLVLYYGTLWNKYTFVK